MIKKDIIKKLLKELEKGGWEICHLK